MRFLDFLEDSAKKDDIDKFVVGAIITNQKGEILLVKRKQDDFLGGFFEIPGGNAEKGEGIYNTLVREIKEETNLDLKRIDKYINYFNYTSKSGKKCRQFNFKVEVEGDDIKLTEHDTYKWIGLNEIEEQYVTPEMRECLVIYRFNEIEK